MNESFTSIQRAIEIAEALSRKGICPFDGKHFSGLSRAACEVCNPKMKIRERERDGRE
jgi:hypothetical protein